MDKPGLKLLGDRQLKFLRTWGADWKGADLKMVLSQTIFCNLANYHGGGQTFIFADLDSNGWPQTGRRRAVEEIRRGYALHLAGDQHLASIVHHGTDDWNDAGYSFCVPSIAAGYPRSWRPDDEGRKVQNRGAGPNTGEYTDGFQNKITVWAIANPEKKNRKGRLQTLHDKASGYGIVRMDPEKGTYTMECWRLLFDANQPKKDDQFPGWPKTVHYTENYGRKATAHLPTLEIQADHRPRHPNRGREYGRGRLYPARSRHDLSPQGIRRRELHDPGRRQGVQRSQARGAGEDHSGSAMKPESYFNFLSDTFRN